MQAQSIESIVDHGVRGLGRITLAPEGNSQPVAKFGVVVRVIESKSDASAELAVAAPGNGKTRDSSRICVRLAVCYELPGILLSVGMWNAQCRSRDFARSCQLNQRGEVFFPMDTQHKAISFKSQWSHVGRYFVCFSPSTTGGLIEIPLVAPKSKGQTSTQLIFSHLHNGRTRVRAFFL